MSKNLQEYLQDNETVLWQGEPAAFPLIENGNKPRVLRTWLLTVVIIGGLVAAYVTRNSQWNMNVVCWSSAPQSLSPRPLSVPA